MDTTTHAELARESLPYVISLSDGDWAVLEPLLPAPSRTGHPWRWPLRAVLDAILYVLRSARTHRPVIAASEPWLRETLGQLSQKSRLAEAIRYALSRWAGLCVFLEDGRVELDSNAVERAIQPLALTRKNALFAGSDGGGQHWTVTASMVESCKLNDVEPHAYLNDVLTRITEGHPNRRRDELLLWAYASAQDLKAVA